MRCSPVRLMALVGLVSVPVTGCAGNEPDAADAAPAVTTTMGDVSATSPSSASPPAPTTTVVLEDGPVVFQVEARDHTDEDVQYPQSPPVGGDHSPVWQNCGVYEEPIREVHAVHSLEHGAVWITYLPDLDPELVTRLEAFATNQTHVLVSPYAEQASPIVLTAWSVQQAFGEFDEEGIGQFLRMFQKGALAPEPGAVCAGGTSEPA